MINNYEQPHARQPVSESNATMIDRAHLATTRCRKYDAIPLDVTANARLTEIVNECSGDGPGEASLVLCKGLL